MSHVSYPCYKPVRQTLETLFTKTKKVNQEIWYVFVYTIYRFQSKFTIRDKFSLLLNRQKVMVKRTQGQSMVVLFSKTRGNPEGLSLYKWLLSGLNTELVII